MTSQWVQRGLDFLLGSIVLRNVRTGGIIEFFLDLLHADLDTIRRISYSLLACCSSDRFKICTK